MTTRQKSLDSEREAIFWIRIAPEDMKLVYTDENDKKRSLDVKKDQLIIRFYDDDFPNRVVVIDSKDWLENITEYHKKMKERRNASELKFKTYDVACGDCEAA